jgi:hypothetical protein
LGAGYWTAVFLVVTVDPDNSYDLSSSEEALLVFLAKLVKWLVFKIVWTDDFARSSRLVIDTRT